MVNEIGLINSLGNLENFKKKDIESLKSIKYKGIKSNKEKSLYISSTVDICCNLKNPLFSDKNELEATILFQDDTLYISNIIFSGQEKIEPHSCEHLNLVFLNCIFLSRICLESVPKSISFDNCYFKFLNINHIYPDVRFYSCVFEELMIRNYENLFTMYNSEIGSLTIKDCLESSKLSFLGNTIHKFRINNASSITDLNYEQFVCFKDNLSSFKNKIKKLIAYKNDKDINTQIYTLNFIKDLQCINEDAKLCTEIDLLKNKILPRNLFLRILLSFCGYFMCPERIIIEMFLTIFIGSILLFFINERENNLLFYLEQSFNSFLCSNDKDISFCEKIVCYLETILGFLEMNTFTIALAKKYLK